jgi:hypothetical protein
LPQPWKSYSAHAAWLGRTSTSRSEFQFNPSLKEHTMTMTITAISGSTPTDTAQSLKHSGLFGGVTEGDAQAFVRDFSKFNPEKARALIGGMTDEKLAQLAHALSGLSADLRLEFFTAAAGSLEGHDLARLSRALDKKTLGSKSSLDSMEELATAVGQHATPEAKRAFVKELAHESTDQSHVAYPTGLNTVGRAEYDPQARSIAKVLIGMDPKDARETFKNLSEAQQKAVTKAAEQPESSVVISSRGVVHMPKLADADTPKKLREVTSAEPK